VVGAQHGAMRMQLAPPCGVNDQGQPTKRSRNEIPHPERSSGSCSLQSGIPVIALDTQYITGEGATILELVLAR
jgi:hypothetical protein